MQVMLPRLEYGDVWPCVEPDVMQVSGAAADIQTPAPGDSQTLPKQSNQLLVRR
jgi:hypothetical protein